MAATRQLLLSLFHHVALPREVPGSQERNLAVIESNLLDRIARAVDEIGSIAPQDHATSIQCIQATLVSSKTINTGPSVDKSILAQEFEKLEDQQAILIHVREQNAALLAYRADSAQDAELVFEAFECAADCESVLASQNALQWEFPASAVSVPPEVYRARSFREHLTFFVERASGESLEQFAAVTYKAGMPLPEIRDTTDPSLITGLLMSMLEGVGSRHQVPLLRKRVRDTVRFRDAHVPWRRSSFYLAIRVALQRRLYQLLGQENGRLYFKTIIALFISRLLNESAPYITHEARFFLMQKLGRRLAKIEQYRAAPSEPGTVAFSVMFDRLRNSFATSLQTAQAALDHKWMQYQGRTRRIIEMLPIRAPDSALILKLPASRDTLHEIAFGRVLSQPPQLSSLREYLSKYEVAQVGKNSFTIVAKRYIDLEETTEKHVLPVKKEIVAQTEWEARCCILAQLIKLYISSTGNLYDNYPELKSMFLLNTMELWVELDRYAVFGFPLLKRYHPGFVAHIMDTLELLNAKDLERVQAVQTYITNRCAEGKVKTIFDAPTEDSFAAMYYDESGESAGLKQLHQEIEAKIEKERTSKIEEWERLLKEYDRLMGESLCYECVGKKEIKLANNTIKEVCKSFCAKHSREFQARRLSIDIYEEPLPRDEPAAKAAIFELRCPKSYSAYRDATWLLLTSLGNLGMDKQATTSVLKVTLHDYSGLNEFAQCARSRVTLGSSTKSHRDSHYAVQRLYRTAGSAVRRCGLNFQYFDTSTNSRIRTPDKVSFYQHTPLMLPKGSPYIEIGLRNDCWPSSNEILASQTRCPANLNVHEFTACQELLSGNFRRWLSLLRELGSTNLNFSTESTWAIVSRLMLQVGPATANHSLRDVHMIFDDRSFCSKLLEQVRSRLSTIRCNWREYIQMDLLITSLLKTRSFSPHNFIQAEATELLHQAQVATWGWCVTLQSAPPTTSQGSAKFALWASLLCRRTMHHAMTSRSPVDDTDLQSFLSASMILKESLTGSFEGMSSILQKRLVDDIIFTFRNRLFLRSLLVSKQEVFLSALNYIWPLPPGASKIKSRVEVLPESYWVEASIESGRSGVTHLIHYHTIRGDVLVDGRQSGTLPAAYHQSVIKMIFGTFMLRVKPSHQPGMTYYVDRQMPDNHRIHLGFLKDRLGQNRLVVRAVHGRSTLQFVDPSIFDRRNGKLIERDLPLVLINDCFHWLDLDKKTLEIRQNDIWKSRPNNWRLNLISGRATKTTSKFVPETRRTITNTSHLVDPYHPLFQKIVRNFLYFERAEHIMATQTKARLLVDLRRLDLSFFVNPSYYLQCKELNAEIANLGSQDIGTWYGCFSKLVLRSIKNERHRIVLVPEGPLTFRKDGFHVRILVEPEGSYLKFDVDDTLGRIHCLAENRLLYTKAMWHAYTASFLPDPLTGRTGTEEALCLLRSGLYKPWSPIRDGIVTRILSSVADLSPDRTYYPEGLKCMEVVDWNPQLTVTIQDDRYRAVIAEIADRDRQLQIFEIPPTGEMSLPTSPTVRHLASRCIASFESKDTSRDTLYVSRGLSGHRVAQNTARFITKSLTDWSITAEGSENVAQILQEHPVIGGSNEQYRPTSLAQLISVDLVEHWGALAQVASISKPETRYELIFLFAPMALSRSSTLEQLKVLISYAIIPELKAIEYPSWPSYVRWKWNEIPGVEEIAELMKDAHGPYEALPRQLGELPGQIALRRLSHEAACLHNSELLAKSMLDQWPQREVNLKLLPVIDPKFLDMGQALHLALKDWMRLAENFQFSRYIDQVQLVLDEHAISKGPTPLAQSSADKDPSPAILVYEFSRIKAVPTLQELLRDADLAGKCSIKSSVAGTGALSQQRPWTKNYNTVTELETQPIRPPHLTELRKIVQSISETGHHESTQSTKADYAREMMDSVFALEGHVQNSGVELPPLDVSLLQQQIRGCKQACDSTLNTINQVLKSGDPRAAWLRFGLWPRTTKVALLSELNTSLNHGSKEALVCLGLRITFLQRLLRIYDAHRRQKQQQLDDERANEGHVNWDPMHHTAWLLLEVDGNIMLRQEQVEVAKATISPVAGYNSVVQIQMGAGKSSCILPMAATALADKSKLLRIVVPRALLHQSAQVLQIKLGGLLNRELLHIPFSRKTRINHNLLDTFKDIHVTAKDRGGIMLCLPEHILSFKLAGLQHLSDENLIHANVMIKFQQWLESQARDVLDECDVSLAIRTQLVYPSGFQKTVDGHPLRWQVPQALLRLVHLIIPELEHRFPKSIEIVRRRNGGFPIIHLLRSDIEGYIIEQIVTTVCEGRFAALPYSEIPASAKGYVRAFISSPRLSRDVEAKVVTIFGEKDHMLKTLYLLRGLLVHRIFLATLRKRWNVEYGLHPRSPDSPSSPIAVPFLAKGVPSPSSEWGHPDVAIILTCLSFYYQGLNLIDFRNAVELLLKLDEPSIEYEKWLTPHVPECWRDFSSINIEDDAQIELIQRHLCFSTSLLDFFLNNFVFPRHAKQFATKLEASGWDLVRFDPATRIVGTTGFSGTNDSRHHLPMTIRQSDLPSLAHTNAEVLSYLLQPRNRVYVRMLDEVEGRRWDEEKLLSELSNPSKRPGTRRIRILIDAGAQILEHDNASLARAWLKLDWEATGAVYFSANHVPMVIRKRGGRGVPLAVTPFSDSLDNCLVYIDESHCRGTDLKLPPNATAALTLGPHVTKDAIAQAAMRLRLLGQSQSVTFFSPPEVHQKIIDTRTRTGRVDSSDVVAWLLKQSIQVIEALEPLYYNQGHTFMRQEHARMTYPGFVHNIFQRSAFLSVVRTKEMQSLKKMYQPRQLKGAKDVQSYKGAYKDFAMELERRRKSFLDSGNASHASALQTVEQEREMEYESEVQREPQNPIHFNALPVQPLHEGVKEFVKTGVIKESDAWVPMLLALQRTATGRQHGAFTQIKAPGLYVSTQFRRTVKLMSPNDSFVRPVHWVLWSPNTEKALIVSPEEADAVLPYLHKRRRSTGVSRTHLIVYSAPLTRRMLVFNSLRFHATPPLPPKVKAPLWLQIELGVFAGRLYFEQKEYDGIKTYLGMQTTEEAAKDDVHLGSFAKNLGIQKPLAFVHEWIAALRKSQDFEHTPMGFVSSGKKIPIDHPFFTINSTEASDSNAAIVPTLGQEEQEKLESDDESEDEDDEVFFDVQEVNPPRLEEDEVDSTFFDAAEEIVEEGDDDDDESGSEESEESNSELYSE